MKSQTAMNPLIKFALRRKFALTTKEQAMKQACKALDSYMALAMNLSAETGKVPVRVPAMRGVDEDMRDWSFFMLLEHNLIVNRSITTRIKTLVTGEASPALEGFDAKKDVMPSAIAGSPQVAAFRHSIYEHVKLVSSLGQLRGTATSQHPIFGTFDAHKWNCMFSFHLQIHLRQAAYIAEHAHDSIAGDLRVDQ